MKVRAYEIRWDTDNMEVDLPTDVVVEMDEDQDIATEIADVLSDKYGFCVFGCLYEVVEDC